ncbi:MAG: uracil phosphoribosyltransferase [Flavobacteriaceae bacterium]|jgi:hypothetical protein|nr:uracil phosphoribosyltransferase [Flavobacteriaceae bacterium]MDB3865871.1 uracil phosphoribosyltransferase [bacterium]MDG1790323.1 uracil phosphoribosyltransferase [Flavobacteriaceae bacterium]
MTWTGFFEGIQSFFEGVAFAPFNALRELEAANWWMANSISWVFVIICSVAIVYWIGQLKKYDTTEGSDDKSITAHKYLG